MGNPLLRAIKPSIAESETIYGGQQTINRVEENHQSHISRRERRLSQGGRRLSHDRPPLLVVRLAHRIASSYRSGAPRSFNKVHDFEVLSIEEANSRWVD
ncbi:hypothetical protein KP509_07G065300 [Ceratopteris richardii]|uniref:Uncharacterized protein n=1 Tax=Ceratopteris richardii TaxID=49495 RepID=A0A8T2UHS5_CERRI|nr:hypothetical protein KP509_07G065300 [Ceratopteris richardii]